MDPSKLIQFYLLKLDLVDIVKLEGEGFLLRHVVLQGGKYDSPLLSWQFTPPHPKDSIFQIQVLESN